MRDKFAIREEVWTALEQAKVVRGRTVHDKIPDFYGSKEAAERVFDLAVWQARSGYQEQPGQGPAPPASARPGRGQAPLHGRPPPAR